MDIGIVGDGVGDEAGEGTGNGGVAHGALLNAFVDAALSFDVNAVAGVAARLEAEIGRAGVVDAAAVAAVFQLNTRAADSAGIAIEAPTIDRRGAIGAQLGFAPRESGIAP